MRCCHIHWLHGKFFITIFLNFFVTSTDKYFIFTQNITFLVWKNRIFVLKMERTFTDCHQINGENSDEWESEWSTFHLGTFFFRFNPTEVFFVGEPQTVGPLLRRLCCLFNGKGLSEKAPGYWISRDREKKETENQSIQTLIRIEGVLWSGLTLNPITLTTKNWHSFLW